MDLPARPPGARLFAGVTDPRVARTRRHLLCDILLLALCATLAGAESFADLEEWAEMKVGWLRTFLELPGGIPSHDTFERVFRRLDPEELASGTLSVGRRCFLSSRPADAARLLTPARGRWAIENNLRWMLDVHFEEDHCRVRKDHGPLNLATLRRVALSLAKRDIASKQSVRRRLKCAGWDDAYLFRPINI